MPETVEAPAAPDLAPTEKEDPEQVRKRARKPPKDGPCRRCGRDRPLNRLMVCYECWVKDRLEQRGWREGQPHPAGCGCAGECAPKGAGN